MSIKASLPLLKTICKRQEFRRAALVLALILLLIFPAKLFFAHFRELMPILPPCPSISMFKLYCPGCGTTRALYSLFHGNFAGVFANNPLMPFYMLLAIAIFIRPQLQRHYRFMNIMVIILILFTVLRNLPWYPFTILAPAGI